jgi:hypothetical protein
MYFTAKHCGFKTADVVLSCQMPHADHNLQNTDRKEGSNPLNPADYLNSIQKSISTSRETLTISITRKIG